MQNKYILKIISEQNQTDILYNSLLEMYLQIIKKIKSNDQPLN